MNPKLASIETVKKLVNAKMDDHNCQRHGGTNCPDKFDQAVIDANK